MLLLLIVAVFALVSVAAPATSTPPGTLHYRSYIYAGQTYFPGEGSFVAANQVYAERLTPARVTQPLPLLLIHGHGMTGTNFLNTPDGRLGWADYFLSKGYEVYIIDQTSRARSAWQPTVNGPLETVDSLTTSWHFTAVQDFGLWPQAKLHTQWPGSGTMGDPIFDAFYASTVPSLVNNTEQDVTIRSAGSQLLDIIGPAIVMTHSQGGELGWVLAESRPKLVKAIVALEPKGPPFILAVFPPFTPQLQFGLTDTPLTYDPPVGAPSELAPVVLNTIPNVTCFEQPTPPRKLTNLLDIPVLVVTSEASYHAQYDNCTVHYLRQAGVSVDHVSLPDVGIHGNAHMFFMEKNNIQIVEQVVQPWIADISK
uniref:AB hydrolase-1 domain-containing protein n=1 Tax=Mycena chlorophos TaxID=658473 RepID=A0ABQ0L503_MYCCL|nr:predicted protein [Mycena chlorophos]